MAVRTAFSSRADGDLRVGGDPAALEARRARLAPHPWTWLHQVHGADVVVVTRPGEHAGAAADASVTAVPGAVLAVQTADCAAVLLADAEAGVVGAAHAGWRGLAGGVLQRTVSAMHSIGARDISAVLGPCIRVGCYEFGAEELDRVVASLGEVVRGTTMWGAGGFDVAAGVRHVLGALGVRSLDEVGGCTACDPDRWFSHRARGEVERLAAVTWIEP
ncbi:MAG: laccase domain-containing protein [Actinobacteria bacterium]|nr:laccase domain-containing protein [Actinomycetota bacterium]